MDECGDGGVWATHPISHPLFFEPAVQALLGLQCSFSKAVFVILSDISKFLVKWFVALALHDGLRHNGASRASIFLVFPGVSVWDMSSL